MAKIYIGDKFGYWTVIGPPTVKPCYWLCRCICGKEKPVHAGRLRKGTSRSCHCKSKETREGHGHVGTRTYNCYHNMIARCHRITHPRYHQYGGRGIIVCERWQMSFAAFLEDMGECPSAKHSIERTNNNKGYSPDNCCWTTAKEQGRNTRRNVWITFNGETMVRKDWATRIGVSEATIKKRLRAGWELKDALTIGRRSAKERCRRGKKGAILTFEGETKTLVEWAEQVGVSRTCLSERIKRWGLEKALAHSFK